MIVIPAIDLKEGRCVRLVQGDFGRATVYADDPAEMASVWKEQRAPSVSMWSIWTVLSRVSPVMRR